MKKSEKSEVVNLKFLIRKTNLRIRSLEVKVEELAEYVRLANEAAATVGECGSIDDEETHNIMNDTRALMGLDEDYQGYVRYEGGSAVPYVVVGRMVEGDEEE